MVSGEEPHAGRKGTPDLRVSRLHVLRDQLVFDLARDFADLGGVAYYARPDYERPVFLRRLVDRLSHGGPVLHRTLRQADRDEARVVRFVQFGPVHGSDHKGEARSHDREPARGAAPDPSGRSGCRHAHEGEDVRHAPLLALLRLELVQIAGQGRVLRYGRKPRLRRVGKVGCQGTEYRLHDVVEHERLARAGLGGEPQHGAKVECAAYEGRHQPPAERVPVFRHFPLVGRDRLVEVLAILPRLRIVLHADGLSGQEYLSILFGIGRDKRPLDGQYVVLVRQQHPVAKVVGHAIAAVNDRASLPHALRHRIDLPSLFGSAHDRVCPHEPIGRVDLPFLGQ